MHSKLVAPLLVLLLTLGAIARSTGAVGLSPPIARSRVLMSSLWVRDRMQPEFRCSSRREQDELERAAVLQLEKRVVA
jgi:hypothetical protein